MFCDISSDGMILHDAKLMPRAGEYSNMRKRYCVRFCDISSDGTSLSIASAVTRAGEYSNVRLL